MTILEGNRWATVAAGLIGAAGVALAAAASHAGGEALLRPASTICLAHAPALLALSVGDERIRLARPVALGMLLGTALFAGDLAARQFLGRGLFPMAAPTGGLALIASWILLAAAATRRQ